MSVSTKLPSVGINRIWHREFLGELSKSIDHMIDGISWTKLGGLDSTGLATCSEKPGIYMFIWTDCYFDKFSPKKGETIVYIGQGINLRKRLDNYIGHLEGRPTQEKRAKILHMLNRCGSELEIWWSEIPLQYLTIVEDTFIKVIDPYFNTKDRLPLDFQDQPSVKRDITLEARISAPQAPFTGGNP